MPPGESQETLGFKVPHLILTCSHMENHWPNRPKPGGEMRVHQLLPKLLVSSFRIAQQAHPDHASRDSPGWTTDEAATSLQGAFNPAGQTKVINYKHTLPTHRLEAQRFDGFLNSFYSVSGLLLGPHPASVLIPLAR